MRKFTTILSAFVALLFVGCAAPTTEIPLSLQVCRGDRAWSDESLLADSVVKTIYRKRSYGQGVMIDKTEYYTVYTPQGYVLREYSSSKRIAIKDSMPDTLRDVMYKQNIFNERGGLVESREYDNDTLREVTRFAYNKKGQVVEIVIQYMPEDKYVPLKYVYAYDRYGNICSEERYENDVFQTREVTRYNRKGQKLKVAHYRADGVLRDERSYTYNRRGDEVESSLIEKLGTVHIIDDIDWSINPFERNYWNKHQTPLEPIEQYDTISTRTTYHGKVAIKQGRRASRGDGWKVVSRTEYNSEGVPTRKMEYGLDVDTLVTHLTIYNSRGLATEEYRYDKEKGAMEIVNRKEYDDRGNCTLQVSYRDISGIKVRCNIYDYDGNLVEEFCYDNGVLKWRTESQYENGKLKQIVKYVEKGKLKSVRVFEYDDDGGTKSTIYDKDGVVIETIISKKTDDLYHSLVYDGKGELLMETRLEHFR